jgi:hypothetical protein
VWQLIVPRDLAVCIAPISHSIKNNAGESVVRGFSLKRTLIHLMIYGQFITNLDGNQPFNSAGQLQFLHYEKNRAYSGRGPPVDENCADEAVLDRNWFIIGKFRRQDFLRM